MGGVFCSGDHSVARDASSAYSVTDAHTPLEDRDDVFDDRVAGSCSVLGYVFTFFPSRNECQCDFFLFFSFLFSQFLSA